MEEIMDKTSETLAEDVVVPLYAEEAIVARRSVAGRYHTGQDGHA